MDRIITWHVFADYLRSVRQHQGISQRYPAEKIGGSEHHLWRLEHEQRPHRSKLILATRYGFSTYESRRKYQE